LGLPNVVITLGASGSLLCTPKEPGLFRAPTVPAVDTTAAGDAFVGALAVGMAAGAELQEAVRLATLAGAAAVTREGAQDSLPDREDLYRMFGDEVTRF
jgi:ribokinase